MSDTPTPAHLAATDAIDSQHPAVQAFMREHDQGSTERERAVALVHAVRDAFRYDPYRIDLSPHGMRASTVIANGYGWCVPKAALLAAVARAAGIPARLGFADVRNHLSTERMRQTMQTDLFIWHGYAYELGRQMGKRAIFTERVDNVMTLKRFRINPGERCIIAEDVVTTGVSSLETKRVIEENGGICVGIACVVDRTRAEAPSPIPIVASALKLDLPNYAPEECPICKEGKLPLVHLGSRKMKEAAKQTL